MCWLTCTPMQVEINVRMNTCINRNTEKKQNQIVCFIHNQFEGRWKKMKVDLTMIWVKFDTDYTKEGKISHVSKFISKSHVLGHGEPWTQSHKGSNHIHVKGFHAQSVLRCESHDGDIIFKHIQSHIMTDYPKLRISLYSSNQIGILNHL